MHQKIFSIPLPAFLARLFHAQELPIYGFGLMLVIGFVIASRLAKYLANRSGIRGELLVNAALIGLVAGIVGSRVSHVLENLGEFTSFRDMLDLRSGGLTYYGGFLAAFPLLVFYAIRKKIPLRLGMDIVAPCLMIGLGFGRIGCFLNGCCYGERCDHWPAVSFPYYSPAYVSQWKGKQLRPDPRLYAATPLRDKPTLAQPEELTPLQQQLAAGEWSLRVLPTQLFSSITALLVAAVTLAYFTVPHPPGRVFALMLLIEAPARFLLELVRTEPPVLGPLSFSMVLSPLLAALGVALWIRFGKVQPADERRPSHSGC